MAVKYYGSCSGNSGSKYNIWLEINEYSQSTEANTSSVKVELKLKRNDGYADSAFNLNENENFSEIKINGTITASKNSEIDTRNNATVTLLSWNGEVSHNADGTLTLDVSGSFTMSGTSLDGGSVSCSYRCLTIPRSSTFTISKSSASTEEEITVNINSASTEFTHKLLLEIGDFSADYTITAGVTEYSFSIPFEWLEALPKSKQGIIAVSLKTYSGKKVTGTAKSQLILIVPEAEELLPEYLVNVTDNKNGLVPSNWSAVVQNKSTVTVKIHTMLAKYGASIISGDITVGGIKKYGTEAEFELPDAGEINITTCVIDSRGNKTVKNLKYNVASYTEPTINCNMLLRCDSSGAISENGTSAILDFTTNYSSVYGLNYCRSYVKYKSSDASDYSEPIQLTTNPFVINGDFQINSSYDFVIYVKDAVSTDCFEIHRTLSSGYIPFNIRKGGKGAAFGCYSENDNELTVGYNLKVAGALVSENLNNSATSGAGFRLNNTEIKSYSCMSLTFIKAELQTLNSIEAGVWSEALILNNITPTINTPLNIATGESNIDKNINCYIDTTGVVKLISDVAIASGTKIYISGIF